MKKLVALALLAVLVAAGCQKKEAPATPVQGQMSSAVQGQASSVKK